MEVSKGFLRLFFEPTGKEMEINNVKREI